jgi:hypothetical protein
VTVVVEANKWQLGCNLTGSTMEWWIIIALASTSLVGTTVPEHRGDAWEYGFVKVYATATVHARRVRIGLVTEVFAFCRRRDRPTSIVADAKEATHRALSGTYGSQYEITYGVLRAFATRPIAEVKREEEMRDERFTSFLGVRYARTDTIRTC